MLQYILLFWLILLSGFFLGLKTPKTRGLKFKTSVRQAKIGKVTSKSDSDEVVNIISPSKLAAQRKFMREIGE